tara:strand:- start:317 stop:484 length:168 start_codon:yes stop_codon:yes gene_type:complete
LVVAHVACVADDSNTLDTPGIITNNGKICGKICGKNILNQFNKQFHIVKPVDPKC